MCIINNNDLIFIDSYPNQVIFKCYLIANLKLACYELEMNMNLSIFEISDNVIFGICINNISMKYYSERL